MPKPEWQDWPEEPWECAIVKGRDAYIKTAEVATYRVNLEPGMVERMVACTNALAGIRNPAKVRSAIESLATTLDNTNRLLDHIVRTRLDGQVGKELDEAFSRLAAEVIAATEAVNAMHREPTDVR